MIPPAAILTDIEGTTTPLAFVHRTLFPFARARMASFCEANPGTPELAEVPQPKLATLLGWMDRDEKITALKTIQGMIWAQGYAAGEITGDLYPDVAPALRRWVRAGLRLYVYSSGSVPAQKLLFRHAPEGDLTRLFNGFFDTQSGPKRDSASYGAIAKAVNAPPAELLFLSDMEPELDAAAYAGLRTCQLVRADDATLPSHRHATAPDFNVVASMFGLPHG